MKRVEITIRTEFNNQVRMKGWLFTLAGLRLVAHKRYNYPSEWAVSEYSTGLGIPVRYASAFYRFVKSRKQAIEGAGIFLGQQTSAGICTTVLAGITKHGIAN